MLKINQEAEYEVVKSKLSKNQKDWIEHFNIKNEAMISAADIYQIMKLGDKKIQDSIKQDMEESWIVTSTQVHYYDNLQADMIQNADSKIISSSSKKVLIPVYSGEIKQDIETEKYFQALFGTQDKLQDIIDVLNNFSGKKRVYLLTPSQSYRNQKPIRAVWLYFVGGDFGVGADGWIDISDVGGFSRGVRVSSAKQNEPEA